MRKLLKIVLALVVIGVVVVIVGLVTMPYRAYNIKQFQSQSDSEKTASIARGRYVALTSDCVACHQTKDRKDDLSGGFAVETPFGLLYASNITPDKDTGIGNWTEAEFADAVLNGKGPHGPLYPAMPYTSYVKMNDRDIHDLWNYLQTVPPVKNTVIENQLSFPFNIRYLMLGWKRLFFDASPLQEEPAQPHEWNRGRYLVEGPAHCSMCHTPRNPFGAEIKSKAFTGANLQNWFAPSLRNSPVHGLADWSEEDLVQYLKTGGNRITVASGPMAEAVNASFQYFNEDDLKAMASYVKSLPDHRVVKPKSLDANSLQMIDGKKVFADNCISCHVMNGEGISAMIPAFKGNSGIQGQSAESMIHVLLAGSQGAITKFNPTGAAMPSFAWKLTDDQAADVLTYLRNSWGNAGKAISPAEVETTRKALRARAPLGEQMRK